MNYQPLPEQLTIAPSTIHGLGLFATEDIAQATNLGMTHLKFGSHIIRTPLGGFINHSNDPNCFKTKLLYTNHDDPKLKFDYKKWNLVTATEIKKGTELTVKYTFYTI